MNLPFCNLHVGVAFAAFFVISPLLAGDKEKASDSEKQGAIDLSQFPGTFVDEVVVPVPSEVFTVLEKLGESNWSEILRRPKAGQYPGRLHTALALGAVVGEGFLAVQAEDRDAVTDIGREVLRLAKALGVGDSVTPHCQKILDAARGRDWNAIRNELDQTQTTVRATMETLNDTELANAVSFAGWLRGTEAVSRLVSEGFTSDKAELLKQPELVAFFAKKLVAMKIKHRDYTDLAATTEGLERIGKLMGVEGEPVTSDAVLEMHLISASLIRGILNLKPRADTE